MSEPRKQFLVRLPRSLHQQLKVRAATTSRSMSDLIEEAVRALLKRRPRKE